MKSELHDIIIIGAGPTGLACALHAESLGLRYLVMEKGTVANTIVGYPTSMTFFSTPDLLELGDMPFTSPNFRPSRIEAIQYYRGVVRSRGLKILQGASVAGVQRRMGGGFVVQTSAGLFESRFVVLATGYFDTTNRLNIPGEELPHVHHYYKEPFQFFGKQVVVVGGRNSAVETALDLYRHGASVTMVHRQGEIGRGVKYWVRPDIEHRLANGQITMLWNSHLTQITPTEITVQNNISSETQTLPCDALFAMIGHRPDEGLFRACGIAYDLETLVPLFNPATFESNVPGLYLAGSVVCGCRTWEVFIENGRNHAQVAIAHIAERLREPATHGH